MRSLTAGRRDNAPSRWAYRFERLMLTPLFRLFLRVVVPFVVVAGAATVWLSDADRRESLNLAVNEERRETATARECKVD